MDIRLLRAFVAVFEERNITQAARRCHVSQSALSNSIRQLEESLHKDLFIRRSWGVEVTEAARLLYPKAMRLVSEMQSLADMFMQADLHPFIIGVSPNLGHNLLAMFLRECRQCMPETLLSLVEWGQQSDARLGPESLRREEELFLPICEEGYVLCMHRDHPLTEKEMIGPQDLVGVDFVTCPPCEVHQRTFGLFAEGAKALTIVGFAEQKRQLLALVLAKIGVTFVPQSFLSESPDLVSRPFEGEQLRRRVGLCYTAQMSTHPFIAALRARMDTGLLRLEVARPA